MALAAELTFTDYDPLDYNLTTLKVQGRKFTDIEGELIMMTLKFIDPQLSDGKTWIDIVAKEILTALPGRNIESSYFITALMRAHLRPENADAQTTYGSITRQLAEDLIGIAVLKQAISTIFWADVANKSRPFKLADTKDSVAIVVSALAPSFELIEPRLQMIAENVVDHLDAQYSVDPDIDPAKIFRLTP